MSLRTKFGGARLRARIVRLGGRLSARRRRQLRRDGTHEGPRSLVTAVDEQRTTTEQLEHLRELYVERANLAVSGGREDLLPGLSDDYVDEVLRVVTT